MSKGFKIFLFIILVIIIGGGIAVYYMWNKPERNIANEKGIEITAVQLVNEFQENELEANKKYLDKVIQVTGNINAVGDNQEGMTTLTLSSDDAFTGVFCMLKEKAAGLKVGDKITIKGICSGMLTDVRIIEAIIVK